MTARLPLIAAAAPLAIILALATPAAATTDYVITYSGTIATGEDVTGVFGTPGADLAGDAYTEAFEVHYGTANKTFSPYLTDLNGSGRSDPLIATLTINGHSAVVGQGQYGDMFAYDTGNGDEIIAEAYQTSDTYAVNGVFSPWLYVPGGDIRQPIDYTTRYGDNVGGPFQIGDNGQLAYGFAGVSTLTTGQMPGIPEPAAWTGLLLGFGLAGAVLRRNRARGTSPAA